MRIKFNRGPQHGKYYDHPFDTDRIEIKVDVPQTWEEISATDRIEYRVKRGDYQRSNRTLKNGAVVFEWLGWRA